MRYQQVTRPSPPETERHIPLFFLKVHARLINGARVKIDVTGDGDRSVAVGALYSSGAHITSAGDVGVSSCHGRIAVHTADAAGSVNLSSVNGIALVSTGAGMLASLHVCSTISSTSGSMLPLPM